MQTQRGFSLVEPLVVVGVVGTLPGIAIPAFDDYLLTGEVPDAPAILGTKRARMAQFFFDNRIHAGAPVCKADTTISQHSASSCHPEDGGVPPTALLGTSSIFHLPDDGEG